jgi:hypothetical protein
MDRDIVSQNPGKCSRCGMKLVTEIPDPVEFHMEVAVTPDPPKAQVTSHLKFDIHDPRKTGPAEKFEIVHEKPFHAFVVSRDLQFFLHDHPILESNAFHYDIVFPKPGMYRILGDFYPEDATPQLIASTVFVAGEEAPFKALKRDYSVKASENLTVEFSTIPPQPIAGVNTQLRFTRSPAEGIEKYLGVWGHMLAVSDDLIDMMHVHPSIADGGPEVLFNVVFPRVRTYRIWVQFQRNGIVNTAHFDIPVKEPGADPFVVVP